MFGGLGGQALTKAIRRKTYKIKMLRDVSKAQD